MKALALTQPWAWVVVHGGKRIENRTWNTSFRGEFLIQASKGMTRQQYDDVVAFARVVAPELVLPDREALARGGIIGRATLADVIPPCCESGFRKPCAHPWHMAGQFGFVLEDVKPTRFVPLRGMLGFFEVPADLAAAAR